MKRDLKVMNWGNMKRNKKMSSTRRRDGKSEQD